MSTLWVVRHGQASFFSDDYDQLSPLGEEQSRRLGRYWVAGGQTFNRVFVGPRRRHHETCRLAGEAFREAGLAWPEAEELPGLDEYAAEEVLKQSLPSLVQTDPHLQRLHEQMAAATDRADHLRRFQRIYEHVMGLWVEGRLVLDDVEDWPRFCQRTDAAWSQVLASGGGTRAVAFTSGGPVGVAVGRALEVPQRKTLPVAWMMRNGAYCEFLFSSERFTLSTFNSFPHLDRPELLTYR